MSPGVENISIQIYSIRKHIFKFLILFLFFIQYSFSQGNIPLGSWRIHTSLLEAKAVAIVDEKVYCGTSGGLFYLDKDEYSLNRLTKLDGFSEVDISAMKYSKNADVLIIGYENGTIDLLKKNTIYTISDIKNSTKTGSKRINHIGFYKNNAILSCDFGAVMLNLDKNEIKESYLNIGTGGTSPQVFTSAVKDDSIFLATSEGILAASFSKSSNLMDFKRWKKIVIFDSLNTKKITTLAILDGSLYAGINSNGVYSNYKGYWEKMYTVPGIIDQLASISSHVIALSAYSVQKISKGIIERIEVNTALPRDIIQDSDGSIWIADFANSLVKYKDSESQSYFPNSPFSNNIFSFYNYGDKMVAMSGGHDYGMTPLNRIKGLYEFDGIWKNYIPGRDGFPYISDVTDAAYDPASKIMYIGTQNAGLVVADRVKNQYTILDDQSTTCPITRSSLYENYNNFRIPGLYFDKPKNELWICNPLGLDIDLNKPTIHKMRNGFNCESFTFEGIENRYPIQLLIDDGNNKWVRLHSGILVFNESKKNSGGKPTYLRLTDGKGSGNLSTVKVNCITKDKKGDIWLGTDKGVNVFYNPGAILPKSMDASYPIFQNRPLLFDQIIICMDVDGGNRKWIGTSNGLYLFSPEGTEVLHYFSTKNTPLPSNNIVSIKVNQVTGEVFIGTEYGIISYREPATSGQDSPSEIAIFPNPIKSDFSGLVGFSNLVTNSIVKITDMSGKLVYETKANGGTASWNGRDYNGKMIAAGVYVVLVAKDDGEASVAGKLFVVD